MTGIDLFGGDPGLIGELIDGDVRGADHRFQSKALLGPIQELFQLWQGLLRPSREKVTEFGTQII